MRPARLLRNAIAVAAFLPMGLACGDPTSPASGTDPASQTFAPGLGVEIAQMTKVGPVLYTQDLIVGTGLDVVSGRTINATWDMYAIDGHKIETRTLQFQVGAFLVPTGLDQGVLGMKLGGKRRIVMGSDLGYGTAGGGCARPPSLVCTIPPNSTLIYIITVAP